MISKTYRVSLVMALIVFLGLSTPIHANNSSNEFIGPLKQERSSNPHHKPLSTKIKREDITLKILKEKNISPPVDFKGVYITSEYEEYHRGIDIASDGTVEHIPLKSVDDGKVMFAKDTLIYTDTDYGSDYGKLIIIDHENGLYSLYAHLNKIYIKEGSNVKKGEKIGIMGSTGNSTGIHLHFEMCTHECKEVEEVVKANPLAFIQSLSKLERGV